MQAAGSRPRSLRWLLPRLWARGCRGSVSSPLKWVILRDHAKLDQDKVGIHSCGYKIPVHASERLLARIGNPFAGAAAYAKRRLDIVWALALQVPITVADDGPSE